MLYKIFLIFQYFQNFASIYAQNSVKTPYTWRLWTYCLFLSPYIYVLFTLWFVSVHETDDEFPSDSDSCSVPLDVAPRG